MEDAELRRLFDELSDQMRKETGIILEEIRRDTKLLPDIFQMLEDDGLDISEIKQTTTTLKTTNDNLTIEVSDLTQRLIKLEA